MGIEPWKYREVELLDIIEKAIFDHLNRLVVFHNQEISFCQRNDQLICIIFKNLVCLFIFQKYWTLLTNFSWIGSIFEITKFVVHFQYPRIESFGILILLEFVSEFEVRHIILYFKTDQKFFWSVEVNAAVAAKGSFDVSIFMILSFEVFVIQLVLFLKISLHYNTFPLGDQEYMFIDMKGVKKNRGIWFFIHKQQISILLPGLLSSFCEPKYFANFLTSAPIEEYDKELIFMKICIWYWLRDHFKWHAPLIRNRQGHCIGEFLCIVFEFSFTWLKFMVVAFIEETYFYLLLLFTWSCSNMQYEVQILQVMDRGLPLRWKASLKVDELRLIVPDVALSFLEGVMVPTHSDILLVQLRHKIYEYVFNIPLFFPNIKTLHWLFQVVREYEYLGCLFQSFEKSQKTVYVTLFDEESFAETISQFLIFLINSFFDVF